MYQNRSIAQVIRHLIDIDVSLQDSLQRGYANLSAMARILRPTVERLVGDKVSLDTIVTTLKRLRGTYNTITFNVAYVIAKSMVNVRTDVARLSLKKNAKLLKASRNIVSRYQKGFVQVLEGLSTITLVYDSSLHEKIVSKFPSKDIIYENANMAAIIVKSPREISSTPGCIATILQQISRRGINIDEVISCYTDTIIVIKPGDVGRAFESLTGLITFCREILSKVSQ
ncbi:MAG: ACT domain-containing protein [Thaumarchaeota archaeon]|nr:ACT domain-containing protein [Candidatus Terraquivivens yellowstonensis]MCL7392383.1 ACT domain-containing protein [Candidatus Terraquivivens yellowstonensis]MCL7397851.1 ACT domain-containing protein [Candidatus Terraquivivens yellowstonensis]MCL7398944.1 ACT domain-containing protein [Candidatus Terraquivivens yellowstonensis]MCL7400556.1 ACT domain-containing protein [Candidatus Terraquivivens yellowstonensis]